MKKEMPEVSSSEIDGGEGVLEYSVTFEKNRFLKFLTF